MMVIMRTRVHLGRAQALSLTLGEQAGVPGRGKLLPEIVYGTKQFESTHSGTLLRISIGVLLCFILPGGIAAVLAAIHALQFLGIVPFFIGPSGYKVHYFSFWYALMYGLLIWVYIWLTTMLWRVEPQAWMFLVVITMFYLILDFFMLIGATTWEVECIEVQ